MNTPDCIRQILKNIGENPQREGLLDTPIRVDKAYKEMFSGYDIDPLSVLKTFTNEDYEEMILVKNINYFSTCEHHLLPFFGNAHIAYIPEKKITGLSKLSRVLDLFARRLQNQERLTSQVSQSLFDVLNPRGVAVLINGTHLCMCSRGIKNIQTETVTTSFLGEFKNNATLRSDFFNQIKLS